MPDRPTFDAALVAGGRSRRFGEDKAFLSWKGRPLYVTQLRKLAALDPGTIWLSTNAAQNFPNVLAGVERLIDTEDDIGPVGGIRDILTASDADFVFILGIDLPLLPADFLRNLKEETAPMQGVVPHLDNRWEPLAALYPRQTLLDRITDSLASGNRRLQLVLDEAAEASEIHAFPVPQRSQDYFTNVNTPEDLAAIEQTRSDVTLPLRRFRVGHGFSEEPDKVAIEEPLEIRVNDTSVAVTMRTPGHDDELATGFLFTEGLIQSGNAIREIVHCPEIDPEGLGNTLNVSLRDAPDLSSLTRHVFTSSSCGVCGKATIESVFGNFPPIEKKLAVDPELILSLPDKLRKQQETFDRTGGLHASALFTKEGDMILLREDVGRHNALDKVIGHALLNEIPLADSILLVSGRISFELMQKSLAARIPIIAGISAPSSLAVSLANESGQTLIGFLRERGFNQYS